MTASILKQLFVITSLVSCGSCWQFFVPLSEIVLTNSAPDPEHTHSEYRFGDCHNKHIMFYDHVHLDHLQVLGKVIVRGWLDLRRIPTCIVLRAVSYDIDMFRSTSYAFQMCVPRISYCHSQKRFLYYYYEWYIPSDMVGGMNWDIYFFGPLFLDWM